MSPIPKFEVDHGQRRITVRLDGIPHLLTPEEAADLASHLNLASHTFKDPDNQEDH